MYYILFEKNSTGMIIVKLMGGLGNQMFQYAAGRAVAAANGDELKLDLSYYRNPPVGDVPRKYELYNFRIVAEEATEEEICFFFPRGRTKIILNKIKMSLGISHPYCLSYFQHRFLPTFNSISGDVYLTGYWQCEKYFKEFENEIRYELTPVFSGSIETTRLLDEILDSNSVCIHVRRTDFLQNYFHGCMDSPYYDTAIEIITRLVGHNKKYIFSDDIFWCEETFGKMPDTTIVGNEHAGRDNIDYLFLMSRCKHFIISNSSFGWWAAWLCTNPEKQVVAPLRWFCDPSIDTLDIVPQEWLRI